MRLDLHRAADWFMGLSFVAMLLYLFIEAL